MEAWSPLMQGQLLDNETLQAIAEKHGKTTAQVILRWDLQNGIITIPKSTKEHRIIANADVFNFELTKEDMETIDALNENHRVIQILITSISKIKVRKKRVLLCTLLCIKYFLIKYYLVLSLLLRGCKYEYKAIVQTFSYVFKCLICIIPTSKAFAEVITIQSMKWIGVIVGQRRNQSEQNLLKRRWKNCILLKCRLKISERSRLTRNGESRY